MYVSSDAGQTWNVIQRPAQEMLTLGITPEGHLIAEEYANLGYRSKDHGATWSREPGFHNNRIMDFAFTGDGNAMAVTQRGIFRYRPSGIAKPDAGVPSTDARVSPDAASGVSDAAAPDASAPIADAAGKPDVGATSDLPEAVGDAAPGKPVDAVSSKSGCSCRTSPARSPGSLWGLALLALAVLRKRRGIVAARQRGSVGGSSKPCR